MAWCVFKRQGQRYLCLKLLVSPSPQCLSVFPSTIFHSCHVQSFVAVVRCRQDDKYTGRKISASLRYVTVRGEGKMEGARGEKDASCAIASPPSAYHGWQTANVCICNGQRSSEISCDKYMWQLHCSLWINLKEYFERETSDHTGVSFARILYVQSEHNWC
jgi:hypothetical protein